MTTLQEDMRKYRNKVLRKEQQHQSSQDSTSNPSSAMDSTSSSSELGKPSGHKENWKEAQHWALCAFVADLQSSVEAGLSTVTGILSVPANSDVSSGIVVDFLSGLIPFFQLGLDMDAAGISDPTAMTMDESTAKCELAKSSIDEFATFSSSHKFLRTLVENPSKVGRLPCFSYTHHSELELSALYKQWPQSQFTTQSENSTGIIPMDEREESISNDEGRPKSCQQVVDDVGKLIEDVLHGRRDISYTDDNVLKLCNETADALSLSVLSIMIRIIESIYNKLRPQIEASLKESKTGSDKEGEKANSETLDRRPSTMEDEEMEEDRKSIQDRDQELSNGALTGQSKMDVEGKLANGDVKKGVGEHVTNGMVPTAGQAVIFEMLSTAPASHRFISKQFDAAMMPKTFLSAVRKEIKLLHSSLPPGIFVKTYEDRYVCWA